jgi:hypothetical protein
MLSAQPGYHSYLLRLWRVGSADALSWRASLEDVRTHEHWNFASLELLFAFLKEQLDNVPNSDNAASDDRS